MIFNYSYNIYNMGSGISSEAIDRQEKYVLQKYNKIKDKLPEYSVFQIQGKIREEYNGTYEKDNYILDRKWRNL